MGRCPACALTRDLCNTHYAGRPAIPAAAQGADIHIEAADPLQRASDSAAVSAAIRSLPGG